MFEVHGQYIRVSRGDTGLITFAFEGIELGENDLAVFTVKRRSGGTVLEKVIEPEENQIFVPFTNEETEKMREGEYEWDLRVALDAETDAEGRITGGREVLTPWPPSKFEITKVVGSV